jgi:hypothetical protein
MVVQSKFSHSMKTAVDFAKQKHEEERGVESFINQLKSPNTKCSKSNLVLHSKIFRQILTSMSKRLLFARIIFTPCCSLQLPNGLKYLPFCAS